MMVGSRPCENLLSFRRVQTQQPQRASCHTFLYSAQWAGKQQVVDYTDRLEIDKLTVASPQSPVSNRHVHQASDTFSSPCAAEQSNRFRSITTITYMIMRRAERQQANYNNTSELLPNKNENTEGYLQRKRDNKRLNMARPWIVGMIGSIGHIEAQKHPKGTRRTKE